MNSCIIHQILKYLMVIFPDCKGYVILAKFAICETQYVKQLDQESFLKKINHFRQIIYQIEVRYF